MRTILPYIDRHPQDILYFKRVGATIARLRKLLERWRGKCLQWDVHISMFCLDMDLIKTIRADHRPVDEELKWIIDDPRKLIQHTSDRSWLRLVDVEQALSLRKYSVDDSIVVEVKDNFLPWNNRILELSSAQRETQCKDSLKAPDISLGASELGAVYLGAVNFTTLARAGRVKELKAGAIKRINAMFATERKPWCFDGW